MIKTFVAVLAFVALAVAQTTLVANGATATGNFAPMTVGGEYEAQVYLLWIPENVTTMSIEYVDTSVSPNYCGYSIYISGQQVPCGELWSAASEDLYPCREVQQADSFFSSTTTPATTEIYPSSYSDYYYVQLGAYVYVTVTRYSSTYFDQTCSYTIKAISTECAAGQVAEFDTTSPTCFPITTHMNTSFTAMPVTTGATDFNFHRFMVPFGTASFTVMGNVSVSSGTPYVTVQYGYAPGYSSGYAEYSGTFESATGNYIFNEVFYLPKAGYVYVGFYYATFTGGSVMVEARVCPTGLGGWNCTYQVVDATANPTFEQTLFVTNPAGSVGAPYTSDAFAYVIATTTTPMLTTYANYTFSVGTGSSTSGYVYFTKNQWSDSNSAIYITSDRYAGISDTTFANIALTPADLAVPGTFVMGVRNYGAYGTTLNVTVGLAASTASSSGQTTDSPATDSATTGTTTGAASSVSACIAMIVLCFTALLF